MKLLTSFFALGAAAVLSASPVQTTSVKLVNAGNPVVTVNSVTIDGDRKTNVDIGPYTLQINGQDYAAMCIDFFDESNVGDQWNAYTTAVGSSNLSNTYHPSDGKEYEEDAFLFSMITAPGVTSTQRTGIQEAAWDIMAYGITNSSYKYLIGDNSYIDEALNGYSTMNLSGYEIISDDVAGCEQEFIIDAPPTPSVPEPASCALMGTGLLLSAGAMAWKRRKAAAAQA